MHSAPPLAKVALLSIGAWVAAQGNDAPPHRHAGWKITYYRTGRIDSIIDGEHFDAAPGTALILHPQAAHAEIAHTAYSNYYLLVDAPDDQPWPDRCYGETAHEIGRLLAAVLREDSAPDRHSAEMINALLLALDITLRRNHPEERLSAAQTTVKAAEQLFEERFPTSISIEAIATELGVSSSSLRHYFATATGMSPQANLRKVRLRHALTMLRTLDLPLPSIAERCGFSSASHLSREVKAETGSPPGRLRRPSS